jgi:adenylate cyclase
VTTTPGERSERSIFLERKVMLTEAIDELIELCRRARLPLAKALATILPRTCELVGARGALIRTYDEQLERRAFRSGEFVEAWDRHVPEEWDVDSIPETVAADGKATLVLRKLDCADEVVGVAAFAYSPSIPADDLERARDVCRTAAEQIDNFLEGIAAAARKQRLSVSASAALRSTVLEEGADRAVELLSTQLGLEEVCLLWAENSTRGWTGMHYRHYRDGQVVADSHDKPERELDAAVQRAGPRALDAQNHDLADILGGPDCVETALINGLVEIAPVGKLIVRNPVGKLDPEGMDVLHIFAECLSQRLVDYDRERRHLSRHFASSTVTQLIREPGYIRRFLQPRVEPVGILFSDMSSFTAISERVLADAKEIGLLIDTWADQAVAIVHKHGGTFDKLVGDCVIGLFGPPFFRDPPALRVAAAIRAGVEIARMTRKLGTERGYDEKIRALGIGEGLGAAAGVNFGPTSVGLVGPNQDYTGFSSYMNNAARLQGVAKWQEMLVMESAKDLVGNVLDGDGFTFEGPLDAKVKNVKDPLKYFRVGF